MIKRKYNEIKWSVKKVHIMTCTVECIGENTYKKCLQYILRTKMQMLECMQLNAKNSIYRLNRRIVEISIAATSQSLAA